MISVEEAIVTRLTGDTTLQNLLGASGHIFHALEHKEPFVNSITYHHLVAIPGMLQDNTMPRQEFYQFTIYHKQYEVVLDRLYRLLHKYRFPTPSDAGIVSCLWDWEGPDEFDEDLLVGRKTVRYKLNVVRQAQAPI